MKHLSPTALVALVLLTASLTGCMPEGSPPDGHVAAPVAGHVQGLQVEFLWPAEQSRVTDDGVVIDDPIELPIRVQLVNHGPVSVQVNLDDLLIRPVVAPGEPVDDDVEAVYPAPAPLQLAPGATRVLEFGQASLFFGFACTVHLTGEVQPLAGEAPTAAISHDSRPILLDF